MIRLLASIAALCAYTNTLAADSYLCVADASAGFVYRKSRDTWEPATLNTTAKYLVSKRSDGGAGWEVKPIGGETPVSFCEGGFTEAGLLYCRGFPDFYFNKNNGRYMAVLTFGYWTDGLKTSSGYMMPGETTPGTEIGKCSPL